MNKKIRSKLIDLAFDNPGVSGKYKLAAGLVYRNRLLSTGLNSYKTHPIMLNDEYREHQVHLHAEAACLIAAQRFYTPAQIASSTLYVVRVRKKLVGSGRRCKVVWETGLACPCNGCMAVLSEWGVTRIKYTTDGEEI